jgi:hypothetical protein
MIPISVPRLSRVVLFRCLVGEWTQRANRRHCHPAGVVQSDPWSVGGAMATANLPVSSDVSHLGGCWNVWLSWLWTGPLAGAPR